jgi:hypothetical protein
MTANYYAVYHLVDNGRTVELTHGGEMYAQDVAACDAWLVQERGGEAFDDGTVTEEIPVTTMRELVGARIWDSYSKPNRCDHRTDVATTQPLRAVQS